MRVVLPYIKFATKEIIIGRQTTKQTSANARGKKIYMIGGLIIAALLVSVLFWRTMTSPSYGQVAVTSAGAAPTPKVAEYQTLTTDFYSINYPGRYDQQPTDLPPAGILDEKVLSYPLGGQSGSSTVTIDIKAAPDGGITLDSAYIKYTKNPGEYKLSNRVYQNDIVDIARSTKGQPETAAMWIHGSFLMNIKLTTNDHSQNIDSELKDLLASVQWRKQ